MFETANVEISAADVKRKLDQGETLSLLDVREPKEVAICKIPNSIHIPIRELQQRLDELEPHKDKTIVVYCHLGGPQHSMRSFHGAPARLHRAQSHRRHRSLVKRSRSNHGEVLAIRCPRRKNDLHQCGAAH